MATRKKVAKAKSKVKAAQGQELGEEVGKKGR